MPLGDRLPTNAFRARRAFLGHVFRINLNACLLVSAQPDSGTSRPQHAQTIIEWHEGGYVGERKNSLAPGQRRLEWKRVVTIPAPSAQMDGRLKASVVSILGRRAKLNCELSLSAIRCEGCCHMRVAFILFLPPRPTFSALAPFPKPPANDRGLGRRWRRCRPGVLGGPAGRL